LLAWPRRAKLAARVMSPPTCIPIVRSTKPGTSSASTTMFGRWREKPKQQEEEAPVPAPITVPVTWPLSSPPGAPKRCALVLYGLPKFFAARSFPTLQACVISRLPFPVDVFVHTYDLRETTNSRNGEVACPLDPSEIQVAKPKRFEITSQDAVDREFQSHFNELKRYGDAWFNHFVSLRNVLRQYNSLQQAYALMEAEQRHSGQAYTVVCCSRMDVLYLDLLPDAVVRSVEAMPPGSIYVPSFHEWELRADNLIYPTGGMNDRFAIGCRHAMGVYANRIPHAVQYCQTVRRMFHTETFLKWHLTRGKVDVHKMKFRFQRIRANGEVHDIDRELQTPAERAAAQAEARATSVAAPSRAQHVQVRAVAPPAASPAPQPPAVHAPAAAILAAPPSAARAAHAAPPSHPVTGTRSMAVASCVSTEVSRAPQSSAEVHVASAAGARARHEAPRPMSCQPAAIARVMSSTTTSTVGSAATSQSQLQSQSVPRAQQPNRR